MDLTTIIDLFNELPENRKSEVVDFINFLRYQETKNRMLKSDKEPSLTFNSVADLMQAIDNAD
ncbi:MAG: DUF2281 domain-containing protein [Nitrospirae bacterium]|nr:DUF2281 domain-containing protein [Nitrospirota bacterium]